MSQDRLGTYVRVGVVIVMALFGACAILPLIQ